MTLIKEERERITDHKQGQRTWAALSTAVFGELSDKKCDLSTTTNRYKIMALGEPDNNFTANL